MIEIHWEPSRKDLRFFAGGLTALAVVAVLFGATRWDWPAVALAALVAVAVAVVVLAIVRPSWLRPIYIAWMVAVFPIGWTVSHMVLATVYFLVFLPIGLLLRLIGYDPLLRKSKPPGESYWIARKPVTDRERYFRQY